MKGQLGSLFMLEQDVSMYNRIN